MLAVVSFLPCEVIKNLFSLEVAVMACTRLLGCLVAEDLLSCEAAGTGCVLLPDGLWDLATVNLFVELVELSKDLTITEGIL